MPEGIATLITTLQNRVRDPQGDVHTTNLVMDLLSRCQQIYNNYFELVTASETVNTVQFQNFYTFSTYLPNSISILGIQENGRNLNKLNSLQELAEIDRSWHRTIRDRFECFVQLGETHFILYPAKGYNDSVTAITTKLTSTLVDPANDTLEIPTDKTPLLLDLVEILLLLRWPRLDEALRKLERLSSNYAVTKELQDAKAYI